MSVLVTFLLLCSSTMAFVGAAGVVEPDEDIYMRVDPDPVDPDEEDVYMIVAPDPELQARGNVNRPGHRNHHHRWRLGWKKPVHYNAFEPLPKGPKTVAEATNSTTTRNPLVVPPAPDSATSQSCVPFSFRRRARNEESPARGRFRTVLRKLAKRKTTRSRDECGAASQELNAENNVRVPVPRDKDDDLDAAEPVPAVGNGEAQHDEEPEPDVTDQAAVEAADSNQPFSMRRVLNELLHCGYYFGSFSGADALDLLEGTRDGTFLVRDSDDDRSVFAVTYRTQNEIGSTRIQMRNGKFSLNFMDERLPTSASLVEVISRCVLQSQNEAVCRVVMNGQDHSVYLKYPLYARNYSLLQLARKTLRIHVPRYQLERLDLPPVLSSYLLSCPARPHEEQLAELAHRERTLAAAEAIMAPPAL